MGRMFKHVTTTWNPIVGCRHLCRYCWAWRLAETKLRHLPQYRHGFAEPRLVEHAFRRRFKPGELVFVSDMGDMWGDWVPESWIRRVLDHVRRHPRTDFLFLTKNPRRYHEFIGEMPRNVILGATIETNRDSLTAEISRAPPPSQRYEAMKSLDWERKIVSIEPILDFDLDVMVSWIASIEPVMVYVGYDNYNNRLPEPPLWKTRRLIGALRDIGVNVHEKTIGRAWYEDVGSGRST